MFERFSEQARLAVVLAQEQVRALPADEIRAEHLLAGVVQSSKGDLAGVLDRHGLTTETVRRRLQAPDSSGDAAALHAIGIDLDAVRAAADQAFGDGAFDRALRGSRGRHRRRRHTPFTRSAKKVMELALREAILHRSGVIGPEHLLLGILRGGDPVALGLITEHVAVERLRADVVALLDRAA